MLCCTGLCCLRTCVLPLCKVRSVARLKSCCPPNRHSLAVPLTQPCHKTRFPQVFPFCNSASRARLARVTMSPRAFLASCVARSGTASCVDCARCIVTQGCSGGYCIWEDVPRCHRPGSLVLFKARPRHGHSAPFRPNTGVACYQVHMSTVKLACVASRWPLVPSASRSPMCSQDEHTEVRRQQMFGPVQSPMGKHSTFMCIARLARGLTSEAMYTLLRADPLISLPQTPCPRHRAP